MFAILITKNNYEKLNAPLYSKYPILYNANCPEIDNKAHGVTIGKKKVYITEKVIHTDFKFH